MTAPRLGVVPIWLIGLASSGVAFALLRLLPGSHDILDGLLIIVLFQGVCLALIGTGRRYWHFTGAVIGFLVAAGVAWWACLSFDSWCSTARLAAAQPELARKALEDVERVRQKYQSSPNPDVQEALRTKLPASIENTRREYAESEARLREETVSRRVVFLLSALAAAATLLLEVLYARSYWKLRAA